jgi:TRAP-type C4-dicarboxylate transport system substrate-binding protein
MTPTKATGHLMLINYALLVNAEWYEGLSLSRQRALQHSARHCVTHPWRSMEQDDHDVLDAMAKAVAKIVLATDTRAWRERLAPLKAHHFAQHPLVGLGYRELAEGG